MQHRISADKVGYAHGIKTLPLARYNSSHKRYAFDDAGKEVSMKPISLDPESVQVNKWYKTYHRVSVNDPDISEVFWC